MTVIPMHYYLHLLYPKQYDSRSCALMSMQRRNICMTPYHYVPARTDLNIYEDEGVAFTPCKGAKSSLSELNGRTPSILRSDQFPLQCGKLSNRKWGSVVYRLSLLPSHCPDKTEILVNRTKHHKSFIIYRGRWK